MLQQNAVRRVDISINSVLDHRSFVAYVYARFKGYTMYLFPPTDRRKSPSDTVPTSMTSLAVPRQYAYHDRVNAKSLQELFRFERMTGRVISPCVTRWSLCLHHLHQGQETVVPIRTMGCVYVPWCTTQKWRRTRK